jgi:hypothetical protein
MARFKRQNKPLITKRPRRSFSQAKRAAKKVSTQPPAGDIRPVLKAKVTGTETKTHDKIPLADTMPKSLGSDTRIPPPDPQEYDDQLSDINRMLSQVHDKVAETEIGEHSHDIPASSAYTPSSFDGISRGREEYEVLEQALLQEQEKTRKMKHELALIKQEFDKEKQKLQLAVRDLRSELHRSEPIAENSFFTLSKELTEALKTIDQLAPPHSAANIAADNVSAQAVSFDELMDAKIDNEQQPTAPEPMTPLPEEVAVPKTVKSPEEPVKEKAAKPSSKKKRLLITGAAAVALLLVLSATLSYQILTTPQVDDALVQEVLDKNSGSIAGVEIKEGEIRDSGSVEDNPTALLAQSNKAQAKVPFDQTHWEVLREPDMGVQFSYPANASEITKTDSSVTVLRNNGYIFKVQKIETALPLKEYWEQIKSSSLNYTVEETKFINRTALHLVLDDVADFPGNRYLVEKDGSIFDFWYASGKGTFDDDDYARVEYMIKTISLL